MRLITMFVWILVLLLAGCPCHRDAHHTNAPSPLIAAARAGSIAEVQQLLRAGADPNLPGGVNGWTPLMHAVHRNQIGTVRALLSGGAKVDARDPSGQTALMMAAGYGYTPIVELLLEHGADPRAEARDGANVLAIALSGVPDLDHFTVGSCQSSTVQALKRKDPTLHLPHYAWARVALLSAAIAKLGGCAY